MSAFVLIVGVIGIISGIIGLFVDGKKVLWPLSYSLMSLAWMVSMLTK